MAKGQRQRKNRAQNSYKNSYKNNDKKPQKQIDNKEEQERC